MASPFADSARFMGIDDLEDPIDAQPVRMAPPRLSSTTRRLTSADDVVQDNYERFNPSIAMEREARLQQDKLEDEAWAMEMLRMQKSAEWNQKIAIQEQGLRAMSALKDMRGDEPDYETRLAAVIADAPLALQDPAVKAVVGAQSQLFSTTKAAREKAAEITRRQEEAEAQRTQRLQDQYGGDVAKFSPTSQQVYREALATGEDPTSAFQKASQSERIFKNKATLAAVGAPATDDIVGDDIKTIEAARKAEESRVKISEYRQAASERRSIDSTIGKLLVEQNNTYDPAQTARIGQQIAALQARKAEVESTIQAYETERGLGGSNDQEGATEKPKPPATTALSPTDLMTRANVK